MISLERIYQTPEKKNSYRVLVDRLWPRGVSKQKAKVDFWLKDIGPSDALRKWFGHDLKKWPMFEKKYKAELKANKSAVGELRSIMKREKNVTLLFGAKDEMHNQAVIIKKFLQK